MILRPPRSTRTDTLFPYTTLFLSRAQTHPFVTDEWCHSALSLWGVPKCYRPISRLTLQAVQNQSGRSGRGRSGHKGSHDCRSTACDHDNLPASSATPTSAQPVRKTEERRVGKECGSTGRYRGST